MPDPKDIFAGILERGAAAVAPGVPVQIQIERPKNPEHGDLSGNVAMQLAKQLKRNPREIATQLVDATADAIRQSGITDSVTIAGAGFLNIKLKAAAKTRAIGEALLQGRNYGRAQAS